MKCTGRSCNNEGLYLLTVKFLNKREWFCKECKSNLIRDGLVINCTDEPLDRACMTGGKCAEQCDAVDCYEAATKAIIVSAGKFGTINLNLCHRCAVTKFQSAPSQATILKKKRHAGQKIPFNQPRKDYGHNDYCRSDHVIEGSCF